MKLPRDLSGAELAKALGCIGYKVTRQTGGYLRLTSAGPPEHHITIPAHSPLKLGTLAGILAEVAGQRGLSRDELLQRIIQS